MCTGGFQPQGAARDVRQQSQGLCVLGGGVGEGWYGRVGLGEGAKGTTTPIVCRSVERVIRLNTGKKQYAH